MYKPKSFRSVMTELLHKVVAGHAFVRVSSLDGKILNSYRSIEEVEMYFVWVGAEITLGYIKDRRY